MKISINLFDSSIQSESRLLKSTQVQVDWKLVDKIYIIGFWREGLLEIEKIDNNRDIIRVKLPINTLKSDHFAMQNWILRKFIALWSIILFRLKIFYKVYFLKPSFISVHNPTFLLVSILLKLVVKCKIVYVPHELESERTGISTFQRQYVLFIEKFAKKWLHYTVLVSPEIENWYKCKLGFKQTATIRNIPLNPYFKKVVPPNNYLKDFFNIKGDAILFIYQGIINQFRGIETLIDVFISQEKCHIVFMGFGELTDFVKECETKSEFIHYHPAVKMDKIIDVTSSADISLFFVDENLTKSYELTTANKFYEGIIAGTPFVISNNFTYMSNENIKLKLGWSLNPYKSELKEFVEDISFMKINDMKSNCLQYGSTISWTEESKVFQLVYN